MIKLRKTRYKVKRIYSPWKKKLLLALLGGLLAGATHSTRTVMKFWSSLPGELKKIDREYLRQLIAEFYRDRLVDMIDISNEETKIVLTERGKLRAVQFKIDEIEIKKPRKWDGKWRLVIFDIPEKFKKARNALRLKLKNLGFIKLQKSVFVFPYECQDEIDFLVEFFRIRSYTRYIRVEHITNEAELRQYFNLV